MVGILDLQASGETKLVYAALSAAYDRAVYSGAERWELSRKSMFETTSSSPRLLLLSAEPEPVLEVLTARNPGAKVAVCTRYDALEEVISRNEPEIAFVFKIGRDPFPRAALFGARSLRWLHNSGAGVDHLVPWDPARITVTTSSGIHGELMAQFTVLGHLESPSRVASLL